jgi:CRISPR-associated exonuclease Cas4
MIFRVSDIKQYMYCPRVIYFNYVMPVDKKTSYKMEEGKLEHLKLEKLENRRKLRRYRIDEGERCFRTFLKSERLGLQGILDLHLITPDGYYPVEFKNSLRHGSLNHKYQLTSYGMLLEEHYQRPVRCGFLYLIPRQEIYPVELTTMTRSFVRHLVDKIRIMIEHEIFPAPPNQRGRCTDCEYSNFCADV